MQVKVSETAARERPMATPSVTATIRFPVDVYDALRVYIERRELNTFVVDAVRERLTKAKAPIRLPRSDSGKYPAEVAHMLKTGRAVLRDEGE